MLEETVNSKTKQNIIFHHLYTNLSNVIEANWTNLCSLRFIVKHFDITFFCVSNPLYSYERRLPFICKDSSNNKRNYF